jgi:capsular exopolysaccharide synthesis family protein
MDTPDSYSVRDVLRIFFSHKAYFIVLPIILTISAYIGGELKTPVYQASVKMFIKAQKKTEAEFYTGIYGRDIITDHSELVRSNAVLSRVVEALRLYERPIDYEKKYASPLKKAFIDFRLAKMEIQPTKKARMAAAMAQLSANISVDPIRSSSLFLITVRDFDPGMAKRIANSVSRSYVIFDLEQQIEEIKLKYGEKYSTVSQLRDYIEEFKKTLNGELIPDIEALGPASVKIVAQAETADMQRGVSKYLLMIFSFGTGILLAISLSAVIEYVSTTVNSPLTIAKEFKIPFLGSLPARKSNEARLISETNPTITKYARVFQYLSDQLFLFMGDEKLETVLITDVEGSEETTIVSANLGIYAANHTGRKVLIIDADVKESSLSKMFNIPEEMGLADTIEGKLSLMNAVQDIGSNLHILPSGKSELNSALLSDISAIAKVVNDAKKIYDLIFIHCPDLKNQTDAFTISFVTDATILVVNEGKVRRQIFNNAIEPLKQKNVRILGTILTNRKYVIPEIIYKMT